jgi:hypothetical protein
MLALATMGLGSNKYILGLMILLINLGARYIGNEVSEFMHKVLNHKFARRFLIFLVIWMGTRDLIVAFVITAGFILLVNTLFNESSSFCILPEKNDSGITKEEYDLAKQLVAKYEMSNPYIPNRMGGVGMGGGSGMSSGSGMNSVQRINNTAINNNIVENK